MSVKTLGLDFGGVLADTMASGIWPRLIPGAFEALRELKEKRFGSWIYVVSHCSKLRYVWVTRLWLEYHRFYKRTGIPRSHVRICRKIEEKADICAELGVTTFVDDRLQVLSNLPTVGTLYLFQPRPDEVEPYADSLPRTHQVNSWQEILDQELA